MKSSLALLFLAACSLPALGGQPASAPSLDTTARYFLEEAKKEANAIEDRNQHDDALVVLSIWMTGTGDVNGALKIADLLEGDAKARVLKYIALMLAHRGDANEAIRVNGSIKDPNDRATGNIAVILSDTDLALGLKMIAGLDENEDKEYRDGMIVKRRVIQGDIAAAEKVLSLIEVAGTAKEEAEAWVRVGQAIRAGDANVLTRSKIDPKVWRSHLRQVLQRRAQEGGTSVVEVFFNQLEGPMAKAQVLTAIARYHLQRGEKDKYSSAVGRALTQTEALGRADPNEQMELLGWSGTCMDLAILLTEAGNRDRALDLIRKAQAAGEASDRGSPLPLFGSLFAGKNVIVYLLARACKPEEAYREAALRDGRIDPGLLPELVAGFAEAGDTARAEELYKKIEKPADRFKVAISAVERSLARVEKEKGTSSRPSL